MKRILLCGNSVLIAGLDSCLRESSQFEIHRIGNLTVSLDIESFDFILTDIDCPVSDDFFSQCVSHPNLPLVSIDSAAGTLTVFEGSTYPVRSIEDILQWLRKYGELEDLGAA